MKLDAIMIRLAFISILVVLAYLLNPFEQT